MDKKMAFSPTDEQETAIKLANDPNIKVLKIKAFAGAGKTSTLKLIAQSMTKKRGIYLAFNKAIVDDVKKSMPTNVEVKTFHSLAFSALNNDLKPKIKPPFERLVASTFGDIFMKGYSIDEFFVTGFKELTEHEKKVRKNLNIHDINDSERVNIKIDLRKQFTIINQTMNYFLTTLDPLPTRQHIINCVDNALKAKTLQEHKEQIAEYLTPHLLRLWNDFHDPKGIFQIPHNFYFKLYATSNPIINKDFILFDEAQDADPLMINILKGQNNKVILVGDPYQQIYEWRGAINALDTIQADAECYLTESFRFGETIANNANNLLDLLGNNHKLVGKNANAGEFISYTKEIPENVQAIICRSNSGVIESALNYSLNYPRKNIFLDTQGDKDDLLATIKAIDDLNELSDDYRNHPIIKLFNSIDDLESYVSDFPSDLELSYPFKIWQKYSYPTVKSVIDKFKRTKENECDVRICTIHKSKGLEFDNVAYCDDFSMFFAKSDEIDEVDETDLNVNNPLLKYAPFKNESDIRLAYVAYTRPKNTAYYHDSCPINFYKNNAPKFELTPPPDISDDDEQQQFNILTPNNNDKPTKRKYTKRSDIGEQARKQASLLGIKKATELGIIGRPKAVTNKQQEKILKLLNSDDWTLKEIADLCNVSLSTIKRIKKSAS